MKTFIIDVAIATTLVAVGVAPAVAQAQPVTIEYADLDISSDQGVQTLEQRVEAGIRKACERPSIREVRGMRDYQACVDSAREQAAEQLSRNGVQI